MTLSYLPFVQHLEAMRRVFVSLFLCTFFCLEAHQPHASVGPAPCFLSLSSTFYKVLPSASLSDVMGKEIDGQNSI